MPLIKGSAYPGPPRYLFNGHLETIIPDVFRRKMKVSYQRSRLTLKDHDFVDLDWIKQGAKRLVILTHGLVGDSNRPYIQRAAAYFSQRQWDILAWNCRSCGGEVNNAFRLYHHGEIEDFSEVIDHAIHTHHYESIALIGYSMGGSITLKYAGVKGNTIPKQVIAAISFCAPFDIDICSRNMDSRSNAIYTYFFRKDIEVKLMEKDAQYPGRLDLSKLKTVRTWKEFDEHFSAPINGFSSAQDFYDNASVRHFIEGIQIPALAVNPINDPIIPIECVPIEACAAHPYLHLETPARGGHVGFSQKNDHFSWMEPRSYQFIEAFGM